MQKCIFCFILIIFIGQISFAQNGNLSAEQINKTNINYKSFVTADNKIFAINDSGHIVIWDLKTLDTIFFPHDSVSVRFLSVAKDKQNQVYFGTNWGKIYRVNPVNLNFSKFIDLHLHINVLSIFFNSQNKIFLIVPYVVLDPISKKYWANFVNHGGGITRRKVFGLFWKQTDKFFRLPQYSYMDNNDRIWMTSSFGEFGGELEIFDTKKREILSNRFDSIKLGLFFPKSVFEDTSGNIFITSGLQHFTNSGEIYKIDSSRTVTKVYNSRDYRDTTKKSVFDDGVLFVGPGAYNVVDNCIYFATTKGFYKALLPKTGKLKNPQLVFNPDLSWEREPLAIGVEMTIKRIEFTSDNKLLFLTANDGIGIYDQQKLVLIK
jgi:hypothetical protein